MGNGDDLDKRIKAEKSKLTKICKEHLDGQSLKTIEGLIENAAFMKVSLLELQELIKETGYIEVYQNGENQSGYKESTAVKVYNATIKNYNTVIKSIMAIMPSSGGNATGKDALLEFLKG